MKVMSHPNPAETMDPKKIKSVLMPRASAMSTNFSHAKRREKITVSAIALKMV